MEFMRRILQLRPLIYGRIVSQAINIYSPKFLPELLRRCSVELSNQELELVELSALRCEDEEVVAMKSPH